MAKETCKHCGKEIGFTSQVKLIDGTFICKDCYKRQEKCSTTWYMVMRHTISCCGTGTQR